MTGFRAETETGVKGAFAGIGKITAGLFAVGGTVEALKKIGEAAAADQAAFKVLNRTLENSGAQTRLYGQSIDDLIKKQAKLKGFSDEELASSFTRLVSATKNSATALRDLGLAEDVSRARHIGVAQAALAISKAEQGVSTALQRLGIVVRPVTTHVDALKAAHEQAAAAGAKFTAQTNALYQSMLGQAKIQDQVATRAKVIATLQQRFGGSAAAFASTASGAWARLQEQVHLFEVFLGERVLPGLTTAATTVGNTLSKLAANPAFRADISSAFSTLKSVLEALGPPLLFVAKTAKDVASAIGAPGILIAVAAYKAFGIAVNLVNAARAKWLALSQAAAASQAKTTATASAETLAQIALARALNANAAAMVANSEAMQASAAIRTESGVATETAAAQLTPFNTALLLNSTELAANTALTDANSAARAALAASNEAAAAAETAAGLGQAAATAGVFSTLKTGLLGLVGGPIGAATLGVAGLAFGIYKLVTAQSAWDRANSQTGRSLDDLSTAIGNVRSKEAERRQAVLQIAQNKSGVEQARIQLQQARAALASTTSAPGTLGFRELQAGVASASTQLQAALSQLGQSQHHLGAVTSELANTQALAKAATDKTTASIQKQIATIETVEFGRGKVVGAGRFAVTEIVPTHSAETVNAFVAAMEKLAASEQKQKPLVAANTRLIAEFTAEVGRMPTRHELTLILNNRDAKAGLLEITNKLWPDAARAVRAYVNTLQFKSAAETGIVRHDKLLLAQYAQAVGRIPTKQETKIVMDNTSVKTSLDDLINTIFPSAAAAAAADGSATAQAFVVGIVNGLGGQFGSGATLGGVAIGALDRLTAGLRKNIGDVAKSVTTKHGGVTEAQIDSAEAAARAQQKAANAQATALRQATANLNDIKSSAADAIQSAADSVRQAQQTLADVISSGKQQITDAITSAKQNLQSIGAKLASDINNYLQAEQQNANPLTGPAAKEYAKLAELIKHGGATPEIERRAQQLSADLQGQAAARALAAPKKSIDQQINDAIDIFAKGPQTKASIARLDATVEKILQVNKVTRAALVKKLGVAAGDELFSEVQGIHREAVALSQGPRRRGLTGQEPSIVRPEQTVVKVQQDIARAQRDLQRQQLSEAKTQTNELKQIAAATKKVASATAGKHYADMLVGKKSAEVRHLKTAVNPHP